VTIREKRILDCIENEFKSYSQISKELDLLPSGVVSTLKLFVRLGFIEKHKMSFRTNAGFLFEVTNKIKVIKQRTNSVAEVIPNDEIQPYIPNDDERTKINELLSQKLSRSEMARQLNMSKTSLLWSIMQITNPDQNDERVGNFIYCDRLAINVYKMIEKSDFTILEISKLLKEDATEIKERILFLEKNEAIKIVKNHEKINFIPLNKILKLRSYRKDL
jgi:DNA-binding MarR family transcriptional regulator